VQYFLVSRPGQVKPSTIKLVFVASPLSAQQQFSEKCAATIAHTAGDLKISRHGGSKF
jgi:hypothetical protein